jgi:serine/threonine protein kinase
MVPIFQIFLDEPNRRLITVSLLCPWNLQTYLEYSSGRLHLNSVPLLINHMVSRAMYCHQQHVLHRDLKPANMLLGHRDDSKLELRLADFGSSVLLANSGGHTSSHTTQSSSLPALVAQSGHLTPARGTYWYAAPECLMQLRFRVRHVEHWHRQWQSCRQS